MKSLSLVLFGIFVTATQAWGGCLDSPRLAGVNIAGAEFNSKNLPGIFNKNYTYPINAELQFAAAQGANVMRLPIRWERIQQTIKGPLDPLELKRIQDTVQNASANGLCVMIDIHNYATYFGVHLADNPELQDGFVDLWLRLASEFTNHHTTAFDLMNEPVRMPIAEWAVLAKRTLAELRRANAKNLVIVAGGRWSGLHDWFSPQNGVSNATAFADLKDPLKRVVIEVHQYADKDYSGTNVECRQPEQFTTMFTNISTWAKTNHQQLFLGEFGTPATTECLATLDKFLELMDDPVWRGWTYWAMGRWWGNYPLALNTTNVGISPQWTVLKKYFTYPRSKKSEPNPPTPIKK